MGHNLTLLLLLIVCASGQAVSGVFTSFKSLEFVPDSEQVHYPHTPQWRAKIDWAINGANVTADDTFYLNMPCVAGFSLGSDSLDLNVGDTVYATCSLSSGSFFTSYSSISCTATDQYNRLQMPRGI